MFNLHISFSQAWSSPEEHFSVAGEGFTSKGRGSRCRVSVFGPLLYGQSWVLQPCSMVLHLLNCQYPDIVSIPPDLAGVADIVNLGQEVGQFCRYLAWCYQGMGEIGTGRWRNKWIPWSMVSGAVIQNIRPRTVFGACGWRRLCMAERRVGPEALSVETHDWQNTDSAPPGITRRLWPWTEPKLFVSFIRSWCMNILDVA